MTKKDKNGQIYQDDLKKLLDLRPVSCSTLTTLKTELKILRGNDWEEDYYFFKGQLKGFMSLSKDRVLQAKSKNDRSKQQSPKLTVTRIPTLKIYALAQVLQLLLQKLPTNRSLQII